MTTISEQTSIQNCSRRALDEDKSTDALVNYKWVCGAFAAYSCITFDPDYAMIQHLTPYLSFHCINALTFGGRNQK